MKHHITSRTVSESLSISALCNSEQHKNVFNKQLLCCSRNFSELFCSFSLLILCLRNWTFTKGKMYFIPLGWLGLYANAFHCALFFFVMQRKNMEEENELLCFFLRTIIQGKVFLNIHGTRSYFLWKPMNLWIKHSAMPFHIYWLSFIPTPFTCLRSHWSSLKFFFLV